MKKRILAALIASAAVLSLAGCQNTTNSSDPASTPDASTPDASTPDASTPDDASTPADSTGEDTPAPAASGTPTDAQKTAGTGNVDLTDEGSVLRIACWNDEFREFFEAFYTVPEGITVDWVKNPNDGGVYQSKLDEMLPGNADAAPEEKIDLFLAEADYIKKYAESDLTLDISTIGVGTYDSMYQYTVGAATDGRTNAVKGVSFQACPAGVIVRKSIAKEVLGTDVPEEIQAQIDSWEKFDEVAAKAKELGYYMTGSALETYRVFANNSTTSYLNDGKFAPTEAFNTWLAQAEKYVENGYTIATGLWDDDKTNQMYKDGKVMCFFGPAWYYNFSMTKAVDPELGCKGDWVVVEGPQNFFWGGTWMLAAAGTDNPKVVADVMNAFTANEDICMKLADGTQVKDLATGNMKSNVQFPNNKNIVATCAADPSFGNTAILDGQNDVAVMASVADGITWDPALHTPYDQTFNETLPNNMLEYLKGNCTVEDAWSNFYEALEAVDPTITH